uniref:Cell death protein 3-like n=1 Tax=Crassostrea virginica TaxID=6565 RepID=A0A8B8EDM7_CRAVI|nr:cell death protein 3-like [Crassostrea virginica]
MMDKAKKNILIKNRVGLVENINIEDGLLTQIASQQILTQRTIKSIEAKKTSFEKVEELLDKISLKINGFEALRDALIANEQEDIVDLYLKLPTEEVEKPQKEETVISQESQTVSQDPSRPQSSPPRLPAQGAQVWHSPAKTVQLQSHTESSTARVISLGQPDSHGIPIHGTVSNVVQPVPSSSPPDHVFHPIQEPSVHSVPPSSLVSSLICVSGSASKPYDFSNAVFLDRGSKSSTSFKENEQRFNLKHFINDPNYQVPLEDAPKTVPWSNPTMINNNINAGHKEVVYVQSYRPVSLQRQDTTDAMTKPLGNHEGNCESPAKRQRTQEKIEITTFEPNQNSLNDSMSSQAALQPVKLQGELDDPEIDLTDGPVTVRVDHSTRQFYISNYQKSYAMRRLPRGKALIINVNEVEGKPPRRGTDIDRDNLYHLLTQLHFDVRVYNDRDGLTAKEIAQKLEVFAADQDHRHGDSSFVCLLSHGEEGFIFGTDGRKLQLDSVFKLFDNSNCPTLLGKPKIFVIQACRGGALDSGVPFLDEHDGSVGSKQLPTQSDMIICFPTQAGYYAWRNRERGSWYIEALVQIFMKYAKSEDICTMLHRVNLLVSRKVSRCPQIEMDSMSQMSEYKSTLRMPHLFFYPGIGSI